MAMRRIRTRGHNASQLPTRQGDLQRGSRGFCGKGSMSIFVTCCLVVAILFFTSTDPGRFLRQKRPASVLPEAKERLPTSAGVLSNDTSESDPALLAQSLSGTRLTDQASGAQQSATQAVSAAHSSAASSNTTADLLTVSADGAQAGGASAESAADSLAAVAGGVAAAASKMHVVADSAAAALAQRQGNQAQGAGQATEADSKLLAAGVAKQQALEELREQQSELAAGVAPQTLIDPREGELSGDLGLIKPDAADDKAVPPSAAAEDRLEAKQLRIMKPTQPPSVFRAAAMEGQASEADMQPVTDSLLQRGQGQSFRAKGGQALAGGLETEPTSVLDDHPADLKPSEQALLDQQAERGASQSGGHAGIASGQSDLEKTAAEVVRARSQQKLVLPEAAATGAGSQATGAGSQTTGAGRGSASAAAAGGTAMGMGTRVAGDPREAADAALQAEDAAAQADLLKFAGGMAAEDQIVLSDTAVGAAGGSMDAQSEGGSWEAGQDVPEALAEIQGETAEAAVRDGSAAAAGRAAGADSMQAEAETEPLAEAEPRAGAAESAARDGSAAAANAATAADIVLAEAAGVEAQATEAAAADSGTGASSAAAAAQSVLAEGAAEGVDEAAALDTQAARRMLAQRRQIWANPGIGPSMSL